MSFDEDRLDIERLVRNLLRHTYELEWVEFKHDNDDAQEIGRNISAIANSAALHGERVGFVVWGIQDATLALVGTTFQPKTARRSNQPLEIWLTNHLNPKPDFRFYEGEVDGVRVVALRIPAATVAPVSFDQEEYIRIGSVTTKLRGHHDKQRALWHRFTRVAFEDGVARHDLAPDDVLKLLDYESFFRLLTEPVPLSADSIRGRLQEEGFLRANPSGGWDVTNLGAIAFGRDLRSLGLERKAVRLIVYAGEGKHDPVTNQITGRRGYAAGFEGLMDFINALLPANEVIEKALRRTVAVFPPIALRELIANALIHQDFSLTGTGPMIEVFPSRIEVTNPGRPLINPLRFLDAGPRSRNEKFAFLMRRLRICEERGQGIDRVVKQAEVYQLPPPDFRETPEHMVAILYAPRPFSDMERTERVRAAYQHAGLQRISGGYLTNASLRDRFGITPANSAVASRIIGETLEAGLIVPADPENRSRKHARYVPFWA